MARIFMDVCVMIDLVQASGAVTRAEELAGTSTHMERLAAAALSGVVELTTGEDQLATLDYKLRQFGWTEAAAQQVVEAVANLILASGADIPASVTDVASARALVPARLQSRSDGSGIDYEDLTVLQALLASGANVLLTRDADLLDLNEILQASHQIAVSSPDAKQNARRSAA